MQNHIDGLHWNHVIISALHYGMLRIRASVCLPLWTLLTRVPYVENTMPSLNSEDKPNALQTKRETALMKNTYIQHIPTSP